MGLGQSSAAEHDDASAAAAALVSCAASAGAEERERVEEAIKRYAPGELAAELTRFRALACDGEGACHKQQQRLGTLDLRAFMVRHCSRCPSFYALTLIHALYIASVHARRAYL